MPNLRRTRSKSRSFIPTMFSPSMSTSPESGGNSPMRCLSRTLLPPPLRPMMTTDSPFSIWKLTPSRTVWSPKLLQSSLTSIMSELPKDLIKAQRQKEIADQNCNGRIDHCLGGSPSYALRPLAAGHPFVARNNGDQPPEDERLNKAYHHIHCVRIFQHVIPRIDRVDAQQHHAHKIARADSYSDALHCEQRQSQMQCEQPGHHKVINRMRCKRTQCVDLLGHAHRS